MLIHSGDICLFSAANAPIILRYRYYDGTGLCLFAKRLENRHKFVWPPIVDGALVLTPAQLALLLEAIDWRRTVAAGVTAKTCCSITNS